MMTDVNSDEGLVQGDSVTQILDSAMNAGEGLLRLTPTWVPRSFLHPGRRIQLHPNDYYRFGADRGGINERWFGSTTEAANEGRVWHEGLSFCLFDGQKFMLKDAVEERGGKRRRRNRKLGHRTARRAALRWPQRAQRLADGRQLIQH